MPENRNVIIHSDNFAVVHILNYYKTKNLYLGACIRNLWMVVARHNITLSAIHIPGKCNVVADILSRWYFDTGKNKEVRNYIQRNCNWETVSTSDFELDWFM